MSVRAAESAEKKFHTESAGDDKGKNVFSELGSTLFDSA
jgi:hypothetical protein